MHLGLPCASICLSVYLCVHAYHMHVVLLCNCSRFAQRNLLEAYSQGTFCKLDSVILCYLDGKKLCCCKFSLEKNETNSEPALLLCSTADFVWSDVAHSPG